MTEIKVDFGKKVGTIQPMNCVNNGPVTNRIGSNAQYYKEAEIPYARLHDSNHYAGYGGYHVVDIHSVFPDFDADPYDPESYDFTCTDRYVASIVSTGTKPFYRLGESIEHAIKKYHIYPPKDYLKWAQICEGIIRHYNEGWADGFNYDIEYWEVWNEPDTGYKQGDSPTWRGTMDEFFEFFKTALIYLKGKFPHLKIGGPSLCSVTDSMDIREDMMNYLVTGERAPLDFFSWHMYGYMPREEFTRKVRLVKDVLKKYGYTETESILNEYNYVREWTDMHESYSVISSLKGSAFIASAMSVCHREGLDMLMYYDARPGSGFNGLFERFTMNPQKTYYTFRMFSELRKLGIEAESVSDNDDLLVTSATDGNVGKAMITHYNDDEKAEEKTVKISFDGISSAEGVNVSVYLLDEEHNAELVREEIFCGQSFSTILKLKNYSTVLISVSK